MALVRFDHIALAVTRMADTTSFLVGELGGVPAYGARAGPYHFAQWRFDGGGRLEILEPLGQDGFLHRFLARHGPGIHHVTFKVPSLREACDRARAHGYTIVGFDDSNRDWKEAFLHPKEALGIVVQLAEAPHRVEGLLTWAPPPGPPNPPSPMRIVGLRLRARSAERARTQWESVLHGAARPGPDGTVIYGWPDSPLGITVEIDPAGQEGPIAIELAGARAVALPRGPHPVLGAVFRRLPGR